MSVDEIHELNSDKDSVISLILDITEFEILGISLPSNSAAREPVGGVLFSKERL